jgi:hypothetical protein
MATPVLATDVNVSCPAEQCEAVPLPQAFAFGQPTDEESRELPPAPIVIQEEDPPGVEASEAGPAHMCTGAAVGSSPASAICGNEHLPGCPMEMPYCTDEDAPLAEELPMPRIESTQTPSQPIPFWIGFFGSSAQDICESSKTPGSQQPRCEVDLQYFEDLCGCPAAAPAQAKRAKLATPTVAPQKNRGQDECSEQACPKIHKVNHPGSPFPFEEAPKRPDVDTMEYRKSDGKLNEYGPGPF